MENSREGQLGVFREEKFNFYSAAAAAAAGDGLPSPLAGDWGALPGGDALSCPSRAPSGIEWGKEESSGGVGEDASAAAAAVAGL